MGRSFLTDSVLGTALSFENRRGLLNSTDYITINHDDKSYTSNNPIDPLNYDTAPFENHKIIKFKLNGLSIWTKIPQLSRK